MYTYLNGTFHTIPNFILPKPNYVLKIELEDYLRADNKNEENKEIPYLY